MLTDKLKSTIEEVDILTDFDNTMIKEQSFYKQILAYFLYLNNFDRLSFLGKLIKNYGKCRTKDVHFFYSMFAGCPVEVVDKTVYKCTQNMYWDELIDKLGVGSIGIVSRSNQRLISKYLNLKFEEQYIEMNIVAANKPEIKDNVYTGDVKLIVTNDNLIDFVREKDYICGREEKKILESFGDSGIYIIDIGHSLYISTKRKFFFNKSLKNREMLINKFKFSLL